MFTVTKEFRFCAAHRLLRHNGKCKRLHGHNYVARVTIGRKWLDAETAMVVDFDAMSTTIGAWIASKWDHRSILNINDHELLNLLTKQEEAPFTCSQDPTAEVMSQILFNRVKEVVDDGYVKVVKVEVFETDTCAASYRANDTVD